MTFFQQIKNGGKWSLKGSWAPVIEALLITGGVMLLFSLAEEILYMAMGLTGFVDIMASPDNNFDNPINVRTTAVIITGSVALCSFLVLRPLQQGLTRWFYRLSAGESAPVLSIFDYFGAGRSYGKSLWLAFQLGLRTLLWSVLFYLPVLALAAGLSLFPYQQSSLNTLIFYTGIFVTVLLAVILSVYFWAFQQRYFLAPYLLAEDGGQKVSRIIKQSVKASKGRRGEILRLQLSFIGWFLLSVLLFPLLYTLPYYRASLSVYARYLIERQQRMEAAAVPAYGATAGQQAEG